MKEKENVELTNLFCVAHHSLCKGFASLNFYFGEGTLHPNLITMANIGQFSCNTLVLTTSIGSIITLNGYGFERSADL